MDAKTLQNIVNKLRSRNDTITTSTDRDNKSSSPMIPMIPTIRTEHPMIPSIPIASSAINHHHHHSPPIAHSEGSDSGDNNGSTSRGSYSQEVRYNTMQKGSASEVR
jgi:hypothetical protein